MASSNHRGTFGIVVRSIGLIVSVYGVYAVFYGLIRWTGMQTRTSTPVESSLVFGAFYSLLGLFLLLKADWIVAIAYRSDSGES